MDTADYEEARVIERARSGDAEAFAWLVERHQEVAFRAAYLILREPHLAQDAAQDGLVRAYRGLRGFRSGAAFRPWLLRIVTNVALNEARARRRRLSLKQRAGALAVAPPATAHDHIAATEEASTLIRAMDELTDDDRLVLHLRYFLEFSEREIAATIGRPAGTVKSRLHRASAHLRDVIERGYPELMERDHG